MAIRKSTIGLAGQVDIVPRRLQLEVTDNFAAITTPGYMTQKGISPSSVYPTDVFDVVYNFNEATGTGTYGEFTCTITVPGVITLIPSSSQQLNSLLILSLSFGGSSTGITTSASGGSYTINGNILSFFSYIALTSKGSQTGAVAISGLPYLSLSDSVPTVQMQGITFTGVPRGYITAGTSAISLSADQTDGSVIVLNNTNFSNTSNITITGFYTFR